MVFLLSLTVLQWIVFVQCFRTAGLIRTGAIKRTEGMLTAFCMLAAACLTSFPLLQEFVSAISFSEGKPISIQGGYLPLWMLGLGGACAVATFGMRLYRQHANKTTGFLSVGVNLSGVMIGLYLLFVVTDQVMFYAPPRQDAGMLNWGLVQELGAVKDIQCSSDMLVVKGLDSEIATYRCPHNSVVIIGRFSGTPIVPWPSYTEGHSIELKHAVAAMMADAKHATE